AETSFLANYLPYLLRQADQTLSAPFYAVLTKHEVARSEWRVLAVLEEFEELSVIELADASLSPQPTVTHAVRRLEGRGLVTRTQGTEDRRQRFVSITAAGIELARLLAREAKMLEADALANAGDLSALVAQLEILTTSVATRVPQRGDVSA
ncbi:MAG: MarR family transcriptional regulator, partial [Acidimicrobiales bacterium]|nr:MarR family transcriptional regulator [Acidimicrobiales bacterium]